MKISRYGVAILLMVCSLANAGSTPPQLDKFWSDSYSEEDKAFICSGPRYLGAIKCSGDYCDDKQYKCIDQFEKTTDPSVYSGKVDKDYKCPIGYYIDLMECFGSHCSTIMVKCSKLKIPIGLKAGNCRSGATISDSGGILEDTIELSGNELFGGFVCKGKNCDDIEMRVCNPLGGNLPVTDLTWERFGDVSGGEINLSYTTGRDSSKESTLTKGLEISATVGTPDTTPVAASITATASIEHAVSKATGWNESVEVGVSCNLVEHKTENVALYIYTLKNSISKAAAKTNQYRCQYGRGSIPAPSCLPSECDDTLSENCQKCDSGALPLASAMTHKVNTADRVVREVGTFVEFRGTWKFKELDNNRLVNDSNLILFNVNENKGRYCYNLGSNTPACSDISYKSDRRSNRTTLTFHRKELPKELLLFHAIKGGMLKGEFYKDRSKKDRNDSEKPDATITMHQTLF